MELPALLRQGVDALLSGVPVSDLSRASDYLSRRYRAEVRDGKFHLSDELAAKAYIAARLPATYAAVRASLEMVAEVRPDFAPRKILDAGAGPGTALWASSDCWSSLDSALLFEGSASIRQVGEKLAEATAVQVEWREHDVTKDKISAEKADLVTLAYVLDELSETQGMGLVEQLWQSCSDVMVVVEPGTPAGWERILKVRSLLLERGAHILAPCAHGLACPIKSPDWCHFSRRVARSRIHRLTKLAEVPWEDEKFIFIAASRQAGLPIEARIIAPPKAGSGKVSVKLCGCDGAASEALITKRDGDLFKKARRAEWGDYL